MLYSLSPHKLDDSTIAQLPRSKMCTSFPQAPHITPRRCLPQATCWLVWTTRVSTACQLCLHQKEVVPHRRQSKDIGRRLVAIYSLRTEEINSTNHLGVDEKLGFFSPSYLLRTPSLSIPLLFFPWLLNIFLVISYTLAPCQDFSETHRMHIPKSKPWSVLALT